MSLVSSSILPHAMPDAEIWLLEEQDFLLSILVPCFNEAPTIRTLIAAVVASEIRRKEIIIVDDGSTDATVEIIKREIEPKVAKVIYHPQNRKGVAPTGFSPLATGNIVIIQDADLEYDPQQVPEADRTDPGRQAADVVYGSRFVSGRLPARPLFLAHGGEQRAADTLFQHPDQPEPAGTWRPATRFSAASAVEPDHHRGGPFRLRAGRSPRRSPG